MVKQIIAQPLHADVTKFINSDVLENSTADINGIYNNFWSRDSNQKLTDKELKKATSSISYIAKKACSKNTFLYPYVLYLATAGISGLIFANAEDKTNPGLLNRLPEVQEALIKLADKVCSFSKRHKCDKHRKHQKSDILKKQYNLVFILFSFGKTIDPNEIDVEAKSATELLKLIDNLYNSGLFNLVSED